jgi:hypothetical protein
MASSDAIETAVNPASITPILTHQLPPPVRFQRRMRRNQVDVEASGLENNPILISSSSSSSCDEISNVVSSEYRSMYNRATGIEIQNELSTTNRTRNVDFIDAEEIQRVLLILMEGSGDIFSAQENMLHAG